MLTSIYGTITALVTPMNSDGSPDFSSFKKLIDYQIDNGINAIVPCGSTGESATMSFDEKCEIIRFTVEYANGKMMIPYLLYTIFLSCLYRVMILVLVLALERELKY